MSEPILERTKVIYDNKTTEVTVYEGTFQGRFPVAIKEQIHSSLALANQAITEAMSQIQLDHPYICKAYDCFLEETETKQIKSVLIVELMKQDVMKEMEERKINACPWSEAELMGYLICLVSALSYAESKGVCHRNIKPQNLFVSWDGQTIKIGDFGSSARNLQSQELTSSLQGSPFFLSPELKQLYAMYMMGNSEQLPYDPVKSDVYSLGLTLLCMATLDFPHQLVNLSALESGTNEVLGSLQSFPYLQQYLRWMLAIRYEDRPTFVQIQAQLQSLIIPEEQKNSCGQPAEITSKQVPKAAIEPSEQAQRNMNFKEILKSAYCGKSLRAMFAALCTTVTLECGHNFHSKSCFKKFCKKTIELYSPPTFKCPRCAEVISSATIEHAIGAKELEKIALSLLKTCELCGQKSRVKALDCRHAFCENCCSEIRRGMKCPVCSLQFNIFLIG